MNWSKPKDIIKRREAEQLLFSDGAYPASGINVWQVGRDRRVIWSPARVLEPQEALSLLRGAGVPDAPEEPQVRSWWFVLLDWIASKLGRDAI